jgi:hypothetical protein
LGFLDTKITALYVDFANSAITSLRRNMTGVESLDTLYKVTASYTAGNLALCNALDVIATTSPFIYSGDLLTMSTTATTTDGAWQMGLLLTSTSSIVHGDICELDLIYRGWYPSAPEYTGFTDEEKVHLVITYEATPNDFDVVLNEFLPNPDISANGMNLGQDSDTDPNPTDNTYIGEWIELYNKGPVAVDVANWYMTDASGGAGNTHAVIGPTNTNTGATIIPPGGWIVVFMNKATLGNANAEEIHLYTDDNVEVDFVAYDNPSDFCTNDLTPGVGNISSSTASGIPGNGPSADCPQNQVAPNKSYARFPDGTGPWYDPVPTPGFWNVVLPTDPLLEASNREDAGNVIPEPVVEGGVQSPALAEDLLAPELTPATPAPEAVPEEPVGGNFSPSGGSTNTIPGPETPAENASPSEPVQEESSSEGMGQPDENVESTAEQPTEETAPAVIEEPAIETVPQPTPVEEPAPASTPEPEAPADVPPPADTAPPVDAPAL